MNNNVSNTISNVANFFNVMAWIFMISGAISLIIGVTIYENVFIFVGLGGMVLAIPIWINTAFVRGFSIIVQSHENMIIEKEEKAKED